MNTEHMWLDLVPPRGSTPGESGPNAGPGDAITITADQAEWLRAATVSLTNRPEHLDDMRQRICRILGPQLVAAILQNHGRGLGTPVVVEP